MLRVLAIKEVQYMSYRLAIKETLKQKTYTGGCPFILTSLIASARSRFPMDWHHSTLFGNHMRDGLWKQVTRDSAYVPPLRSLLQFHKVTLCDRHGCQLGHVAGTHD